MRLINKLWLIHLTSLFILLSLPMTVLALEEDMEQPIQVEADSVEIDESRGTSIYKGNVILSQGSIRLAADIVTVTQYKNKSDHVQAKGRPVVLTQNAGKGKKKVEGRGNTMEYDVDSEVLLLIGNAVLTQGRDSFKSDRIAYDRKKAILKGGASAKGKQRVKATFRTKRKKSK